MCGRYAMSIQAEDLRRAIEDAEFPVHELINEDRVVASLNVAPQSHSMIYSSPENGVFTLEAMKWSLQPSYAKEPVSYPSFNARVESLNPLKSAWKSATKRRGILFMEAYYEWQRQGREKRPYFVHEKNNGLLAVLVVWDNNPHIADTPTYTIVTTPAAPNLRYIHHRMPAVASYKDAKHWIDGKWPQVLEIIHPFQGLESYRVSPAVNKVGVETPTLTDPYEEEKDAPIASSATLDHWFSPAKRKEARAEDKGGKKIRIE